MRKVFAVIAILAALAWWVADRSVVREYDDRTLDIQELIQRVKAELRAAEEHRAKANESALFQLEEMEMEINYVVRAGGDAKIEVVGVGGGFDTSSEKVQKIRLRWKVPLSGGTVPRGGVSTETPEVIPAPASEADR